MPVQNLQAVAKKVERYVKARRCVSIFIMRYSYVEYTADLEIQYLDESYSELNCSRSCQMWPS